jgi:hypothetical protein
MNFGNFGAFEMVLVLIAWGIPLTFLVRFVRTLSAMALSLRDIAERLATLERAVRDSSGHRAT